MRALAREHGGRCLATKYTNAKVELLWRCAKGHEFWKTPAAIRADGSWCPTCSPRQAVTLERLQRAAARRGGRCLALRALGSERHVRWECAEGHRWWASTSHVLRGSWCPECAPSRQMTIGEMRDLARARGGRCLSTRYVKSRARLRWACREGHAFEATPTAVIAGRWCLVCKRAAARRTHRRR
jgi:hypothetical protein